MKGFSGFIILGFLLTPFFIAAQSSGGRAALFLSPASGSFLVGSTFDVSIVLDTKAAVVNTVEVELNFPADKIQVASPSVGRSIIQLWPAPPTFSNQQGKIYFVGGIPSPGIVTSQGVVLTLTFRVVGTGEGQISFGPRTSVLANDGKGTNILGQKPSAFFRFLIPPPLGPAISSPTHPDQDRWYSDNNPVFIWSGSRTVSNYSYSIDQNPGGFPDTTSEGQDATASFQNLTDGIWYFHLREGIGGVWGGVSHYVVKIDSTPPADFEINVSPGKRTTNRNPIFRFFTTDELSGFDHFEMKIIPLSEPVTSQGLFFEVASPYQAQGFNPGRYQVVIRALDRAGNTRDSTVTMNIVSAFFQFIGPEGVDLVLFFVPWRNAVIFFGIAVLVLLIILADFWYHHKYHLGHAFREDLKRMFKIFRKNQPPSSP